MNSAIGGRRRILAAVVLAALAAGCGFQPAPELRRREGADAGPEEPNLGIGNPWTGWDDARAPLVSFDAVGGWRVEPPGAAGATQRIEHAVEPFTAGHAALRLVSTSTQALSLVRLLPPAPVPVPEPFDTLELRLGCHAEKNGAPAVTAAPPASVFACLEDAQGRPLRVGLGAFERNRWVLGHARQHRSFVVRGAFPYRLTAIEIEGWGRPVADELYLRNLAAYVESREPVVAEWRGGRWAQTYVNPARRVLHGDGSDPFGAASTRWPAPATSAPPVRIDGHTWDFAASATEPPASFRVTAGVDGVRVECRVDGAVAARWNGFARNPPAAAGSLRVERAEPGRLVLAYANGDLLRIESRGVALLVGIELGTRETSLAARRMEAPGAAAVSLPLLNGPVVVGWRPDDPRAAAFFACAYFDPWSSSATGLEFTEAPAGGGNAARVAYGGDSFARLVPLRETFVLAFSPRIEDVLPALPVRSGAFPGEAATRVWRCARAGERAPPLPRGMAVPIRYDDASGAPEPLPDGDELLPANPLWTRDAVRRDRSGNWVRGAAGATRLKMPFLRLWAESCTSAAPVSAAAQRVGVTRMAPWDLVDFDGRSPGAATFAAPLRAMHGLLAAVSADGYRPAVIHEDWAWLYASGAGACAGGPGLAADWARTPWLPLFALQRLRNACPLVAPPWNPADGSAAGSGLHRHLAACFVHGAVPLLPGGTSAVERAAAVRMAGLAEPWVERSGTAAVVRVAFEDGATLRTASEALADGSWRRGRLYVGFDGGLELWVNGSTGTPWTVRLGGDAHTLPPFGWFGAAAGKLLTCSVTVQQRRLDHARGPRYVWHDGGGSEAPFDGVACARAVLLCRAAGPGAGTACEATFPEGAARLGVAPGGGPVRGRPSAARAFGAGGEEIGAASVAERDGWFWIEPPAGTAVCRIEWTE